MRGVMKQRHAVAVSDHQVATLLDEDLELLDKPVFAGFEKARHAVTIE